METEPPAKPDESDCCNSGCNPCILDVYEEQLKKYKREIKSSAASAATANCILPTRYSVFKLINLEKITEQTFLFTFEYHRPLKGACKTDVSLAYNPGQHFLIKGRQSSEEFTRAYTPIPKNSGSSLNFTTLIKLYKHGKMSNYLKTLSIGDETLWRGPYGKYIINYNVRYMLLIAQGTGIAPIYSILYNMIQNEDCCTFLKLYFCCSNVSNIYLREELYNLCSHWNFTYEVFLGDSVDISVKYNEIVHTKKLEYDDIKTYLKDKYETTNVNVLICGSDNFMEDIKNLVLRCSMVEENVFTFE